MTDTSGNRFARLSRRTVLGGIAFGTAALAVGGNRYRVVLAQGATPTACLEPIDTSRLDMIKTVPEGTKLAIAIVPKGVHPFFEDTRKGGDEEATKLGDVDFQWVAPQTFDAALQVQMIEDLITKKVNAIVISPNDPDSVIPVIQDGMSKGVLMMTFDSDSPKSERLMYIGTDNKTAGSVQGKTLSDLIGGSGKVAVITGGLAALNLNQRIDGLKSALGSGVEVVDTVATDDDLQKGLGVSESLLRAHPDLNGIACVSATGGPTLAQVIQGPEFKDLIGKLKIVAFDDLDQTKQGITGGIIDATMVQRPVQMGVLSVQWTHDILTGAAKPDCAALDTGVTVVTKDNINNYTK